ncbi:2-succinyl-6-hydroxy-2,4-cyclohexadiene-1-carboxylate synthase [Alteripontixanthobacter maritimus]|uniref:2-succinyl-6-hydroxy-2, 4-cyclohexadiene-1-carboxylate synthase n=1 Tax=Alteripontixanthobacter maritimus TaxID=2161824 RepID=A0A369QDU8_9SPHN|nr:alpha/beta hydrolase [Alteripontixanthobacter maritimus]RDC60458.1 2-succinyl-6-hydroxy-2,4-cyclohexadiene-1-carboxylate synthase [Alteripontixanthobacter maritimus]
MSALDLGQQTRVKLSNGIELDVLDTGTPTGMDGAGETLIFLHGFPESHRTWRHQIAHFRDRYRCIAPDQRGYRGSSNPQEPDAYTPDKLIGDVFLLADALGVGKFTIVGHDWGGAIAWGVALLGQGIRVERAIIANAPHPAIFGKLLHTHPGQREASQYIRAFRDPANDPQTREHGLKWILQKVVKWDRPGEMEPEERDTLLEEWRNPDTAIAMLNWYRASPIEVPAMDEPFELPATYAAPVLPKLSIPTLVIWALDDLALPPENLDGMEDIIDDLTIVKVPDCGHFVPWEAPDAVNAAMDTFLAGI